MGFTPTYDIPYPELTDIPDGAGQMKALAEAIDASLGGVDTKVTGNTARIAALEPTVTGNTTRIAALERAAPLWSVYSNAASAATGTAMVAGFTAPSATYKAGRAYRLEVVTLASCNVAATQIRMYVLDTNVAGLGRGSIFHNLPGPGQYNFVAWPQNIANTTAADINRVLVLGYKSTSDTNTVFLSIISGNRYWVCTDIGLAADHPEAYAL